LLYSAGAELRGIKPDFRINPGVIRRVASNGYGRDMQKVMVLKEKEENQLKYTVNLAI
jgi:hypothetical protein